MVLRSQFFDFSRETLYFEVQTCLGATCLGAPGSGWFKIQNGSFFFLPTVNAYLLLTSLKVCDWSGHIFATSASPRSLTKKMAMSPSSTVHGGQHDTKYVTFELLMHAAFVADEILGFMLEPARMTSMYNAVKMVCEDLK